MQGGFMKRLGAVWTGFFACLFAVQTASAANVMKPVVLPSVEGKLVGAAFSPDSSRLAVIENVAGPGISGQRHVLQIVELKSGKEVAHADVLDTESVGLATSTQFIEYSPDGHYLLLATKGSDVLSIIDATTLHTLKRIALHPAEDARMPLGQGHRYFKGVVSLAGSTSGDVFGVLTHDELQGNEVFVGSFSSGQIIKGWSLGKGRTATQLGQTSVSLNGDGSRIAVSVLPDENSLPKGFNNLRLYNSSSGDMVKSIRTDGLVGQVALLPSDNVLAARIDTPGLFSKKACLEGWHFSTGALGNRFCDQGRNVSVALAVSLTASRVAGFASQMHKSIEGQVYAASGIVDVWDMKSGNIVASSDEIPRLVSHLQISPNGEWVMADQMLFQLGTAP
jgi:WD40 repeat protein